MKQKRILVFSLIATILIVGAAFFLPHVSFVIQENRAESQIIRTEISETTLDLRQPKAIFDVLRLVSNGYERVVLNEGASLDAEGAYRAALDAISFFSSPATRNQLPKIFTTHIEIPILAFDKEESDAVLLWECEMENPLGDTPIRILIDDASGKMVSYSYSQTLSDTNAPDWYNNGTWKREQIYWSERCIEYYGFDVLDIRENSIQIDHVREAEIIFSEKEETVAVLLSVDTTTHEIRLNAIDTLQNASIS